MESTNSKPNKLSENSHKGCHYPASFIVGHAAGQHILIRNSQSIALMFLSLAGVCTSGKGTQHAQVGASQPVQPPPIWLHWSRIASHLDHQLVLPELLFQLPRDVPANHTGQNGNSSITVPMTHRVSYAITRHSHAGEHAGADRHLLLLGNSMSLHQARCLKSTDGEGRRCESPSANEPWRPLHLASAWR
jgi:hypothetical protein